MTKIIKNKEDYSNLVHHCSTSKIDLMNWLSSNWSITVGWAITLSIAIIGWIIEAVKKRKDNEASAKRIRELEKANKNLERQAKAQEELAKAAAGKPREDPFGEPEVITGNTLRLRNESLFPVFVDSFDGKMLLDRPRNVPGIIEPKESMEFMAFFAANADQPEITVKWHWKDRPNAKHVSKRFCHK